MPNIPPVPSPLDLLVVAPHPDDAELGAGGMLALAAREGLRAGVLDLTDGEPTPHGSPEIRARETAEATGILQLAWRGNLGLPNRSLEPTLTARRQLAEVFRLTRPEVLFAPYWEDAHPDHVAATALVEAARFWAKLTKTDMAGAPFHPPRMLYYFAIHLRIHPRPAFVLDVSSVIDAKLASVRAYHSQFVAGRPADFPTILDDVRDRARYWGWSIHAAYGEPFASREELPLRSLRGLL